MVDLIVLYTNIAGGNCDMHKFVSEPEIEIFIINLYIQLITN